MGVGYSVCEGIKIAQGDYFYSPGADLEYKMDDVYKMMEKIEKEKLDAVFGSRLADRRNVSKITLIKERSYWLGTIITTFLINLLYQKRFTDIIGTNLIKTAVLKKLNCNANGQAVAFEIVGKLCKRRCKIGEVPVWYKPRTHREGKTIRATDIIPALVVIFKAKFLG